jgi:hypothetical protein
VFLPLTSAMDTSLPHPGLADFQGASRWHCDQELVSRL